MRHRLGLRHRPADLLSRVPIGLPDPLHVPKGGIWANRPVEALFYYDAPNPFRADGWRVHQISYGWGRLFKEILTQRLSDRGSRSVSCRSSAIFGLNRGDRFLILHVYAIDWV